MHLDVLRPFVAENVKKVLAEKGVFIENELPILISKQAIDWADKIIIAADNVYSGYFPLNKTETWRISDCDESDIVGIKREIEKIEKDILKFIKNF